MQPTHVVNCDLAKIQRETPDGFKYLTTLGWGEPVEVKEITPEFVRVAATAFDRQPDGSVKSRPVDGFIRPPRNSDLKAPDTVVELTKSRVLKVDFVDVQQGDAALIETPAGKTILLDGGDNQLFARYLATRFRKTSEKVPKDIDCICVSHGDADHFVGLMEIYDSEKNVAEHKRLFIAPRRVYHNGLVKRPVKTGGKATPETKLLGTTRKKGDELVITDLARDLLKVPDSKMNKEFLRWKKALAAYNRRRDIEFRRLSRGDDDAFDFLADEQITVEVLGPIESEVGGKRGLTFLGSPKEDVFVQPGRKDRFTGKSASHTINGHSVILRLTYGQARFLFAGDLNEEAAEMLVGEDAAGELRLQAEVLKVPHHGSGDYSGAFLQSVSPVISVVSSGDENARKEYIHPRANLITALGRYSRPEVLDPLVFVTELVAFFQVEGKIQPEAHKSKDGEPVIKDGKVQVDPKAKAGFFAFSRAAFGLVKVRTDGKRLLVWTNSGQVDLKEAYAYDLSGKAPVRVPLLRA